ncbi:MAG: hypothetical protein LH618_15620 [Saprospiraceae bacterium]|nr:hypothetical protein [Saprospiraceae bacterium]
MFRLILYQLQNNRWHYVRLTVSADRQLRTETGSCGQLPDHTETATVAADTDLPEALRTAGAAWQAKGYEKPHQKQLQVLTLHFQMPRWTGYPAGAPWYDDWTSDYLDPIERWMEATCDGIPKNNERFSGNHLYYYTVFNGDLARQAMEEIAANALVRFPLDIYLGEREKQVKIPIDPNVPDYLRSLFRSIESSARIIARELPTLFPGDPLQPQAVVENGHKRIRGEEAARLRRVLKEKWHFDSNFWNPLVEASPTEVVVLNGLTDDKKAAVTEYIRQTARLPIYLLECETGLFEIQAEQIFAGAYEGMVFDASLEWVIYFSHHYTTTFGGADLMKFMQELYQDQPALLNNW